MTSNINDSLHTDNSNPIRQPVEGRILPDGNRFGEAEKPQQIHHKQFLADSRTGRGDDQVDFDHYKNKR